MKTNDIVKLGIDRNFIRECERQGLITPNRVEGNLIIDDKYRPREYSREDLEIIWGAYLLRKMEIPFSEIKKWWNREDIQVRSYINDSIEKCERQIEELQATIKFMKYVRGNGHFPPPPRQMGEVSSFKNYINEYIRITDQDGRLMEYYEYVHQKLELGKIPPDQLTIKQKRELRNLEKNDEIKIRKYLMKHPDDATIFRNFNDACRELAMLKDNHYDFASEKTQNTINELFNSFKEICHLPQMEPFGFFLFLNMLFTEDTDASELFIKEFGEENVEYLLHATLVFAKNESPESFTNSQANLE